MSRRTALKLGLVGIAGVAVGGGATAMITRLGHTGVARYRFFSEAEAGLLIEVCEQIIPGDDVPGATDTGAIFYIDRQLRGPLARFGQVYRRGLESLRLTCLDAYRRSFSELTLAERLDLLRAVESGRVPEALWPNPAPQEFFRAVLDHTMQSFYGSPRHGGNRGYASYRMLGLDYPQIVGQDRRPGA